MPVTMREAQGEDWLEDLREFGPDIVSMACGRWRRSETRRPTIADIRRLCIEERAALPPSQTALPAPQDRETWARAMGWNSYAERQEAIRATNERYAKAEAWRAEQKDAPVRGFVSPAAALGVTAREYRPTPEQLAASRKQLVERGDLPETDE